MDRLYRESEPAIPLPDGGVRPGAAPHGPRREPAPTRPAAGRRIPAKAVCRALAPVDAVVILAAAAAAYGITLLRVPGAVVTSYALVAAIGATLALAIFAASGVYAATRLSEPTVLLRRLAAGWVATAVTLITAGFLTGTSADFARFWAFAWFGMGLVGLVSVRWLLLAMAARWLAEGRIGRRVAIVGDGEAAARLARYFTAAPERGIQVAGLFSDTPVPAAAARTGPAVPDGVAAPVDGDLDALVASLRADEAEAVIVAMSTPDPRRIDALRRRLGEVPVDVRLWPGGALPGHSGGVTRYAGLLTLDLLDRPLDDRQMALKAIEDRVVAAAIVALISPLLLVIAAAIKLDSPGPVLFRQPRYGYNNRIIQVLKFRTMATEATDSAGDQLTTRNDARVTRVGAFLRAHSLDELPQFLNVLRGDMSIVGPRPHALAAKAAGWLYADAVPHYDARHRVKPGITGLAQIRGWRGPTETVRQIRKRVEHDLIYIDSWSLWLDLKIIVLTAWKGFRSDNAF